MSTRLLRPALLLLTLAGATGALAACTSSTSYSCSNDDCTVTLTGAGSDAEVGSSETEVALVGSDGTTAEFSVDGEAASCAQGDAVDVAGFAVTCTEVGEDRLVVEMTPA